MKKTNVKKEKLKKHSNKGITLIALVITIIVLLILAGVSIAMLTGENGILTKATESKEETGKAQEEEEIKMAYAAAKANKVDQVAEDVTADELNAELDKLNSTGEASGSGTLTVTFENGHKYTIDQGTGAITGPETGEVPDEGEEVKVEGVTIPKGFVYVGGTKEEGIVISDNPADKDKGTSHEVAQTLVGNQFVWVPVEDDSAFKRYEGYANKNLQSYLSSCNEPYSKGYATEQTEYDAMKQSVLDHDGFYVARYEAGTESGERTSADKNNIDDEVVFKQGKNVYNYIKWGNSMTDPTGGAVEKAKGMYADKEKYGVTSTLIYGIQWDAIMAWLDPAYTAGSCDTNNSFVANSTGKGYYNQSSPTTTGSNANYAVKNIYDLAGNVWEWTMEACNSTLRVTRGGRYDLTGDGIPASYRGYGTPSYSYDDFGFRSALYL